MNRKFLYILFTNLILKQSIVHASQPIKIVEIKGHITSHFEKKLKLLNGLKVNLCLFVVNLSHSKYSRTKTYVGKVVVCQVTNAICSRAWYEYKTIHWNSIPSNIAEILNEYWQETFFSQKIFLNKRLILSIIGELNKV